MESPFTQNATLVSLPRLSPLIEPQSGLGSLEPVPELDAFNLGPNQVLIDSSPHIDQPVVGQKRPAPNSLVQQSKKRQRFCPPPPSNNITEPYFPQQTPVHPTTPYTGAFYHSNSFLPTTPYIPPSAYHARPSEPRALQNSQRKSDMHYFQQPAPEHAPPLNYATEPPPLMKAKRKVKTKYQGVFHDEAEDRYFGRFKFEGQIYYTEYFFDAICAAKAYDEKVREMTSHLQGFQSQVRKFLNFPDKAICCTDEAYDFYFDHPQIFPSTRGGLFLVWGTQMYHNDRRENEGCRYKFRCRSSECGEISEAVIVDDVFIKWVRMPAREHPHASNFTKPLIKRFRERFHAPQMQRYK